MAYRQLFAVTFAMLGLAVGCGSGGAAAVPADADTEQPPENPDQAPNDSDPASNSDQAPVNPDQPPASDSGLPGPGGGAGAEGACRAFCDGIKDKDCSGPSGLGGVVRLICDSGCVLSAEDQACASQIAAAIACVSGLSGLCTEAFMPAQAQQCQAAFAAAEACDEANDPDDGNGNGNGNGNNPPPSCTTQGGCECASEVLSCICEAGNDIDAAQACVQQ